MLLGLQEFPNDSGRIFFPPAMFEVDSYERDDRGGWKGWL